MPEVHPNEVGQEYFKRRRELEEKLMYAVIVAGKSAKFAERAMKILGNHTKHRTWFESIRLWDQHDELLRICTMASTGNYTKIVKAFREMAGANLALERCTPDQLEAIHGIGPKTSRFFILWTRPKERYAALDIHILRWLKAQGHDVPATTPQSGKKYKSIEQLFLAEADKRRLTPRQLDAEIWSAATGIE